LFFTGAERNGRKSGISLLFGRPKFEQILIFQKNNAKFPKFSRFHLVNHLPVLTEMGEIWTKFDFFEQNLNL
jgi:hypothetical protein